MQRSRKTVERTLRYIAKDAGKQKKTEKAKEGGSRRNWKLQTQQVRGEWAKNAKEARKVRNEDWALGPLAPNRAVGWNSKIPGALGREELGNPNRPEFMRRKIWAIKPGDRVAIMKGKDSGKIGEVESIQKARDTVTIKELNRAYIDADLLSTRMPTEDGEEPPSRHEQNVPIPYSHVRLVHGIYDHRDGQYKEVIVEKVKMVPRVDEFGRQTKDYLDNEDEYDRYIPGMELNIPWPNDKRSAPRDTEVDTPPEDVSLETFEPTLLRPPMPEDAVNEIRNPYTPSRKDHSDEVLARRAQRLKEREQRKDSALQVRTPLQELRAQQAAARKKEQGDTIYRIVPDDVLQSLGATIRAQGKTNDVESSWKKREAANHKREQALQKKKQHREELMQEREDKTDPNYKPKPQEHIV